ncbi:MAG: serine--tRNA ligase, partial [Candidatus Marsarchaeota archaeon]|nr:serine--tRNA ligase [Candidatus Marsarchaeota archaeon]
FRDNLEAIKKSLAKRNSKFPLDELLALDEKARKNEHEVQELRTERNKGSEQISDAKKAGKEADKDLLGKLAEIKKKIEEIEGTLPKDKERLDYLLWNIPNIAHDSVPKGKDDSENPEIRKWGTAKEGKPDGTHEEILNRLGFIDIETAAKVSGARFFYLKGDLALLEQSVLRFSTDLLAKKGFMPISPPFMLRKEVYNGIVPFATFEDALYRVSSLREIAEGNSSEKMDEDLFLISTTEHPMIALHAGEMIPASKLPIKYVGLSPAFRKELGAHGKDTKGIFRVHQFVQTEQVVICRQEDSWKFFNEMIGNIEEIWRALGIPHRIIEICSGDLSSRDAKSYDCEAWIPSQQTYREVASCSNVTDWQSRRLGIRYEEGGERKYAHTLNATGVPTPRALIPIIENNLNSDGTVTVPDVLVPYMGKKIIGK